MATLALIFDRRTGEFTGHRWFTKSSNPLQDKQDVTEFVNHLRKRNLKAVFKPAGWEHRDSIGRSKVWLDIRTNEVRVEHDEGIAEAERQRKWDEVRSQRNQLLQESDWTEVASHLDDAARAQWRTYRQALRDLTKTDRPPTSIQWPVKPAK